MELSRYNVSVTSVQPGAVQSAIFDKVVFFSHSSWIARRPQPTNQRPSAHKFSLRLYMDCTTNQPINQRSSTHKALEHGQQHLAAHPGEMEVYDHLIKDKDVRTCMITSFLFGICVYMSM